MARPRPPHLCTCSVAARIAGAAGLLWLGLAPAAAVSGEEASLARQQLHFDSPLAVKIDYPRPGARLPKVPGCGAYVAGHAGPRRFDVVLVIDTSASTADPSGADIDGDGMVGRAYLDGAGRQHNTDPGDSVMAAEVAAARQLLRELDAESTRAGVVSFAGREPGPFEWLSRAKPSAKTWHALSSDHDSVEPALASLARHEPEGSTDMAAAIDEAVAGFGLPDATRRGVVMLFTDGYPTLPHGPREEAKNVMAVLDAANRARAAGVAIHTFAIGREAIEWPLALVETSERTGGVFTPVRHPADLVDMVQHTSVGDLRSVTLRNATTGETAWPFVISPDGAFHGFVPLVPGANDIEVKAGATRGDAMRHVVPLALEAGATPAPVPKQLVARRTRLLEECLRYAKQKRRAAEAARAEQVRRRLAAEIERERAAAHERAAAQRKRLELDIERR
jgi:hypothetical protein